MADEKCVVYPDQGRCLGLAEAALLRKRIEDLEEWQKDSKKFHNDFYDWQRTQIARDAKLDERLETMNRNIEKLLTKQEACDAKPGRFIDSLKTNAVQTILAGIIGFLLAALGLGL